jgi:acid phosphatase (class A)
MLTGEEDALSGEGSYPSGHTMRGWTAALLLAQINPAAADALYARAWQYGVSRVIAGAHWQSDVDVTRVAASIGYSRLQTSPAFRAQMERAKAEFAAKPAVRPTGGRD